MPRKRYSRKFQRMAVERMRTCENVGELARELGVRPRCLYKWRAKLDESPFHSIDGTGLHEFRLNQQSEMTLPTNHGNFVHQQNGYGC